MEYVAFPLFLLSQLITLGLCGFCLARICFAIAQNETKTPKMATQALIATILICLIGFGALYISA